MVADQPVTAERPAAGPVVCLDFQSIAGIIDAVAGVEPWRLSTLLAILDEGRYRKEMRAVLRAAVVCRDPLSELGSICKDALRTQADLEKLIQAKSWVDLGRVIGHEDVRACALLNACDDQIARCAGLKKARLEALRARLERTAEMQHQIRAPIMELHASLLQARCHELWQLFGRWRHPEDS